MGQGENGLKKMLPIGYNETKMGRGIAIFFMIIATILSIILVNSGMKIKYTIYLFGVAVGLGFLFVLTDLYSNKNNKTKIIHMEKMLKCPYAVGTVVEVKKYYYGLKGKLKEIKPGHYIKSKYCAYTIIASFIDDDNNEVLVESEPYATSPEGYLKNNRVNIHYSTDNEFWIDIEMKIQKE